MSELRYGTILIEVTNSQQSLKLAQIEKLDDIDFLIIEHPNLNYSKGNIRSERFTKLSDEALLSELEKYSVTEIYKMKRKIDGVLT